jgi:hypothetical protein
MDTRKETSDKLMKQLLANAQFGSPNAAMKRLQEQYLAKQIDQQSFMFSLNDELQKIARQKE